VNRVRIVRADAHNWGVEVWHDGKETVTKGGEVKTTAPGWRTRSYTGKLEFAVKWAIEESAPAGLELTLAIIKEIEANIIRETKVAFK
jgi:hypothetical protein